MTHILQQFFFDEVDMVYLAKITANVKKNMNPASFGADFLYDENIDYAEKKKLKVATLNGPPSV